MPPQEDHRNGHGAKEPTANGTIEQPLTNGATEQPLTNGSTAAAEPDHHDQHIAETRSATNGTAVGSQAQTEDSRENGESPGDSGSSHGTKRKASNPGTTPHKAPRQSPPTPKPTKLSRTDQVKLLNFLLSPASLPLARPEDEAEALKHRPNGGAKTRTYATSPFTPFEELLCALIISRPIGHMLGLRSIRTLLNPPYMLMSPKMIRDMGVEGVRHALDVAKTQHRQKTAEEIVLLAHAVDSTLGEDYFDVSLERVREECGHDMEKEREMIQKNVKGMGKTGLDIFARRIQGSWGEWYPFADQKTLDALEKMGLPRDTQELKSLLDEKWKELNAEDVVGDGEERKRRVFVKVLERAVGAELEGNVDELKAKGLE